MLLLSLDDNNGVFVEGSCNIPVSFPENRRTRVDPKVRWRSCWNLFWSSLKMTNLLLVNFAFI